MGYVYRNGEGEGRQHIYIYIKQLQEISGLSNVTIYCMLAPKEANSIISNAMVTQEIHVQKCHINCGSLHKQK